MKKLFKQTKVVYDAHLKEYVVYYKNWLSWRHDQTYKVGTYLPDDRAKELAIERAKNMLDTVEIYRSPGPVYYP
jgi:uncharacterized membrane protein YkoI